MHCEPPLEAGEDMAKFNGPREPFRPPEPASRAGNAGRPLQALAALPSPDVWTESSFDLRQGLDVFEHAEMPPAAEPPPPDR
jgi:hypothetical protein